MKYIVKQFRNFSIGKITSTQHEHSFALLMNNIKIDRFYITNNYPQLYLTCVTDQVELRKTLSYTEAAAGVKFTDQEVDTIQMLLLDTYYKLFPKS